jgi:hypothetical protein
MRVGKKNRWLWVFHHDLTAVFLGNQSRAKTVVQSFLGDWRKRGKFPGVLGVRHPDEGWQAGYGRRTRHG